MKQIYSVISYIIQPLLIPTYCAVLLMWHVMYTNSPLIYKAIIVIGTLFLTALIPAVSIGYMIKKGDVKDLFISNRKERTVPYILTLLSYFLWIFFLITIVKLPMQLNFIAASSVVSLLGLILVNRTWKISAHTTGVGGLLGCILSVSYLTFTFPIWTIIVAVVIAGAVSISRIELKAHTPAQALAGFVWGLACCLIPAFIL